jgi:hypothetical protein
MASLLKNEGDHGPREALVAEMSRQFADSDPYYVKYWKMIKYAMENSILERDLEDFHNKIPKTIFSHIIIDLDFRVPRGAQAIISEIRERGAKIPGKQLTKKELGLLVLLTAGSSFMDNISMHRLEQFANQTRAEMEAEFEAFRTELAEEARRKQELKGAQRADLQAANERREEEDEMFGAMSQERKELGNLAKKLLKTRMLPTSCSMTAEKSDTAEDLDAGKFLSTIRRNLRLVPLRTKFLSDWENISEVDGDQKANEECHLGDGDRGLCDALARCMWGDEVYGGFLDFKVNQELQDHRDWYAKRVGLASAHIAAGTGIKMSAEHDNVIVEFAQEGVNNVLDFLADKVAVPEDTANKRHLCFVHVFVEKVVDLELPTGASHIDPFVAVSLGEHGTPTYQSYRTVAQKDTLEPTYNAYCTFVVDKYQDLMNLTLGVRVSDENFLERGALQPQLGAAQISLFQYAKPGSHFQKKLGLDAPTLMGGMLLGSIAGDLGAGGPQGAVKDAKVHIDIYIGSDTEAEKSSLRMLAAANVIKRPVFSVATETDKDKHGLGYFAALGLFPPLRDITPNKYNQSPVAVGWRDEDHSILLPMVRSSKKHHMRPKGGTDPQADNLDWEIEDDIKCGSKMSTSGGTDGQDSWTEVLLCVQIMSARNLQASDKNGFSDPVLKLTVGKHTLQHHTTKICKKTLDPVWMETVCFPVITGKQQIKIVVNDDDGGFGSFIRIGADKLGESCFAVDCRVENPQFSGGKVLHQWITLKKGKTAKHQEVEMKFMLSPLKGHKEWDPFFGKDYNMLKYADEIIYRDPEPTTVMPFVTKKIQQVVWDLDSGVITERGVFEKADELIPASMLDVESIAKERRTEAKEARKNEDDEDQAMLQQIMEMTAKEEELRKQLENHAETKKMDIVRDARAKEREEMIRTQGAEQREDDRINAIVDPEERKRAKKERMAAKHSKFAASKIQARHRGNSLRKNKKNAEHMSAARKIQSLKRGNDGRKEAMGKANKMKALKAKKDARKVEQDGWSEDSEANSVASKLQALQRGKIARQTTAQKKAAGTLPAQVAKKNGVKKFVEFEVFTYEDPTGSLPEDVMLKFDATGIRLHSPGSEEVIVAWKWGKIKGVRVDEPEEDGTVSEAEQTDLVHIKVDTQKFCFEADDGAKMKDAATTWHRKHKEAKKNKKKKPA